MTSRRKMNLIKSMDRLFGDNQIRNDFAKMEAEEKKEQTVSEKPKEVEQKETVKVNG